MRIAVVGGHGKVARLFGDLVSSRHQVVGLIRDPKQAGPLEAVGMDHELIDLEAVTVPELAKAIEGCDVLLFAAGAGPGSGARRKETVDYAAAIKSIEAARRSEVNRFLIVSAMGTDNPPSDDSVFSVYLRAKARADAAVMESGLDWTVVRPGRLTDEPGVGRVELARHVPRGDIPRQDVAAVLAAAVEDDRAIGQLFEVVSGAQTVSEAIASLGSVRGA